MSNRKTKYSTSWSTSLLSAGSKDTFPSHPDHFTPSKEYLLCNPGLSSENTGCKWHFYSLVLGVWGLGQGTNTFFLWPAHWFKTILSFLIAEAFPNRFNCFHESDPQTAMTSQDVKQHSSTQEKRSVWTCKGLRWDIIKPWTMSTHSSKIRPTPVPTLIKAYWKSPAFSSSLLKLTLLNPISNILQKVEKCQKKEHKVRYGGGNGKKGFAHCWKNLEISWQKESSTLSCYFEHQIAREVSWI